MYHAQFFGMSYYGYVAPPCHIFWRGERSVAPAVGRPHRQWVSTRPELLERPSCVQDSCVRQEKCFILACASARWLRSGFSMDSSDEPGTGATRRRRTPWRAAGLRKSEVHTFLGLSRRLCVRYAHLSVVSKRCNVSLGVLIKVWEQNRRREVS